MHWGTVADWIVAAATITLAVVAVFQDRIRSWLQSPELRMSIAGHPPDCVGGTFTDSAGNFIADTVYLRLWVENTGNSAARQVEVYAKELRRLRADDIWERVEAFPPMNLAWANLKTMYMPLIPPQTGKHCDLGHVPDPAHRATLGEENRALGLTPAETSLTVDLVASLNHRGHIVGSGRYQLDVVAAAENAAPKRETIDIRLAGPWYADWQRMLRDGVGVHIVGKGEEVIHAPTR